MWISGDPDPTDVVRFGDRNGHLWERIEGRPGILRCKTAPQRGMESWPEFVHFWGPITDWDSPESRPTLEAPVADVP